MKVFTLFKDVVGDTLSNHTPHAEPMSDSPNPRQQLSLLRAGKMQNATRLDLSNDLTELPAEVFDLTNSLEVLNLSGNKLTDLPHELSKLKKLRIIFCSNNLFTHVPEVLGECESLSMVGFKACNIQTVSSDSLPQKLQWLILTDNKIKELPGRIGNSQHLQKCMLAGNQLSTLPDDMQACRRLELLRISANRFESLPQWLLQLPRLSWLALAGNPFNRELESQSVNQCTAQFIDWNDLTIQQPLGEGASGVIYRALRKKSPTTTQEVAVKIFKGSVTSDGLPESEMAAFIAAGDHKHLSSVKGVLSGHPDRSPGIVMSLIDSAFTVLANPPSFESCTRDVYDPGQRLEATNVIKVALGVASAAEHLHSKGLMHGDLYGHNILHDTQGQSILSDFGGASFLPGDKNQLEALQRLEVRAFACLLEELLYLCSDKQTLPYTEELSNLQRVCASDSVNDRPLFTDILARLLEIQAKCCN